MEANTTLMSFSPRWATSLGSTAEDPSNSWLNTTAAIIQPPAEAIGTPVAPQKSPLQIFSATCLYFGVELIDALGEGGPPIGLIQTAVGGSTIEAWMSNETLRQCTDMLAPKAGIGGGSKEFPFMQHQPAALYYGYITPWVNMTIAGWVWYQVSVLLVHLCPIGVSRHSDV